MAVGQWLIDWTGDDSAKAEMPRRCPEVSSARDPVEPTDAWSNYRSTQPAQEAAAPLDGAYLRRIRQFAISFKKVGDD